VEQFIASEGRDDSVLVDLDTGSVLDALSVGIVVLDAQLCAVYANVTAEDTLALQVAKVRGQPLARFLPQPQRFLEAVNRALERGEAVEFQLEVADSEASQPAGAVSSRIAPLGYQVTGPYLLLEVSAGACRR
jgi:nitrogen-specific signal transduction histidine kinase